jgi:hypothetical protein
MLRILTVSEEDYNTIWCRLLPMQRRAVDWMGTDALLLFDVEGPLMVTISHAEVITEAPVKLKRLLESSDSNVTRASS